MGLIEIMPPATLHGVGVIAKLYFAVFEASKESMTLNLAQRSFKVIHLGGNRKPMYDFIYAVYTSFRSIFNRFGDIADFIPPSQLCRN